MLLQKLVPDQREFWDVIPVLAQPTLLNVRLGLLVRVALTRRLWWILRPRRARPLIVGCWQIIRISGVAQGGPWLATWLGSCRDVRPGFQCARYLWLIRLFFRVSLIVHPAWFAAVHVRSQTAAQSVTR